MPSPGGLSRKESEMQAPTDECIIGRQIIASYDPALSCEHDIASIDTMMCTTLSLTHLQGCLTST